ncbi:MAG: hypothetical protein ACODAF_04435 [Actinomycetota bacterium]
MARRSYEVAWPTLWVVPAWIEAHCRIPDGWLKGRRFRLYDWQLWSTVNHWRVRPDAVAYDDHGYPTRAAAFHNRRSLIVATQKVGKGPMAATWSCVMGVGPDLFAGWAGKDDGYACSDHGCGCGWERPYKPGEPMGMPWPTPLVQLLATSVDQVDNVYLPLKAMARQGPLSDLMLVREDFIRLRPGAGEDPDENRIDVVTSSARARLGNPVTGFIMDETGLYTRSNGMIEVAETMRRGAAGMGGRGAELTNPWDPLEQSVAQRSYESQRRDIFRFYEPPPKKLNYQDKRQRRKIHEHNYAGSPHVNLDTIEAEAAELLEKDPAQAERFYGGRIVRGLGTWMTDQLYEDSEASVEVPDGEDVCLGFDGSDTDDWTAIRLETFDGHLFTPTYGPDSRPTIWLPEEWGGTIPRGEVHAAMDEINERYALRLAFCDPREWKSEIGEWAQLYGEEVFLEWATHRVIAMHDALERSLTDYRTGRSTHDSCELTKLAMGNARKAARPGGRYILAKPSPSQKIDPAMADVLAHEAASVAREKGWTRRSDMTNLIFTARSTRRRPTRDRR